MASGESEVAAGLWWKLRASGNLAELMLLLPTDAAATVTRHTLRRPYQPRPLVLQIDTARSSLSLSDFVFLEAVMNRAYFAGRYVRRTLRAAVMISTTLAAGLANAAGFQGKVTDDQDGSAIIGAMVTARFGDPFQERTVFTDDQGRYVMAGLPAKTGHRVRVRRIGWEDLRSWDHPTAAEGLTDLDLAMSRHSDPAEVAAQLPANHWYGLLLDKLTNEYEREQFVRQCTFCHQQGNAATRLVRDKQEWEKVLALMARMGAGLDADLRARMPDLLNSAYDPATAVPALTKGWENAHELHSGKHHDTGEQNHRRANAVDAQG